MSGIDHDLIEFLITHRVPATFFMSGKWIDEHDAAVKQLLAVPYFEVGTHGKSMPICLSTVPASSNMNSDTGHPLKGKYGRATTLFRPPYGEFDDVTVQICEVAGATVHFVEHRVGDPDPALSADHLLRRLEQRIKPGSVIVLHANGKGKHTRAVTEEWRRTGFPAKGSHRSPCRIS